MRILIDIVHMADVNFYKESIKLLRSKGHEVIISVMNRGMLPEVVKKELGKATTIGDHSKGNLIGKSYSNIKRVNLLVKFIKNIKPDIVTSFSYYPAAAVYGNNIPSVIFHDDAEYKKQFRLCKLFAKKLIIPDFISAKGKNIRKYHSYKEWAYLNPKYFKPNESFIKKYHLKKNGYVVIREIAPVSLNYNSNNKIDYHQIIELLKKRGLKVIVSLEDKSRAHQFKNCIILKEPVKEFYSILYHALALISSGDTMAREAALLGVPTFYVGKREMQINKELVEKNFIKIIRNPDSLAKELENLTVDQKEKLKGKMKRYTKLLDDPTSIITNEIIR